MKNIRGNGNQASLYLQHEEFDIPDADTKEFPAISTQKQTARQHTKKNIIGLSEDSRFKQLILENQRLKSLVETLMSDKLNQAHRIMELNEEKSRLKKALADLILMAS